MVTQATEAKAAATGLQTGPEADPQADEALLALSALAHHTRLAVFRLLIREGPAGLPAGTIAERVGATPPTLSTHLAQLQRAGLITSRRVQRQIFYAAHVDGIRQLLTFLTEDCCQGRPELCGQAFSPL